MNPSEPTTLVTGATGFIGRHLARSLADRGADVHATSRNVSDVDLGGGDVQWWAGDLRDRDFVRSTVGSIRPDRIFHLAGLVSGSRSLEMVLPTLEHNLLASVHLLEAAARIRNIRFVLVGSVEEADSESELSPARSPYAAAKRAASDYGRMFCELYDLSVVHVCPAMVYGPGQRDLSKLVPYVVSSLLDGETPPIHDASRKADWVYVGDIVSGLIESGYRPGLSGRTIELGTGELTSVGEIVRKIHDLIDPSAVRPGFENGSERPLEYEQPADTAAAEELLDWEARMPLDRGLRRTVEWYAAELDDLRE